MATIPPLNSEEKVLAVLQILDGDYSRAYIDHQLEQRTVALVHAGKAERFSLQRKLSVFGLSLLAFILIGWLVIRTSESISWLNLLGLVGVLFIHELGHYIGMKIAGYRNVQMFFIPLFGAAVSGNNPDVTTFDQTFMVLLGPLPGLIIGICLEIASLITNQPAFHSAARLFVLLNGLNLLPLYPLDGGRIFDLVITNRFPKFKVLFQLAVMGLLSYFDIALNQHIISTGFLLGYCLPNLRRSYIIDKTALALQQKGLIPEIAASPIPSYLIKALTRKLNHQLVFLDYKTAAALIENIRSKATTPQLDLVDKIVFLAVQSLGLLGLAAFL